MGEFQWNLPRLSKAIDVIDKERGDFILKIRVGE